MPPPPSSPERLQRSRRDSILSPPSYALSFKGSVDSLRSRWNAASPSKSLLPVKRSVESLRSHWSPTKKLPVKRSIESLRSHVPSFLSPTKVSNAENPSDGNTTSTSHRAWPKGLKQAKSLRRSKSIAEKCAVFENTEARTSSDLLKTFSAPATELDATVLSLPPNTSREDSVKISMLSSYYTNEQLKLEAEHPKTLRRSRSSVLQDTLGNAPPARRPTLRTRKSYDNIAMMAAIHEEDGVVPHEPVTKLAFITEDEENDEGVLAETTEVDESPARKRRKTEVGVGGEGRKASFEWPEDVF